MVASYFLFRQCLNWSILRSFCLKGWSFIYSKSIAIMSSHFRTSLVICLKHLLCTLSRFYWEFSVIITDILKLLLRLIVFCLVGCRALERLMWPRLPKKTRNSLVSNQGFTYWSVTLIYYSLCRNEYEQLFTECVYSLKMK